MTADAARHRIESLPIWSGPLTVEPLPGGLSNANFRVDDGRRRVMVRLGDDLPAHHVFRAREVAASRAAHAAGLSPAVLHAEAGVIVFDYLDARSFGPEDVRANIDRVLALVAACHRSVAAQLTGPASMFWVFHVIRDYAATLRAAGRDAGAIEAHVATAGRLEAAQVPLPIVFGHHDLLPANILDDGRRLWLIDWEYGGFGTAMFDLANLAGNAGFSPIEESDLLAAAFGRVPDNALLAAFDAMKAASLLREAMWAMVSDLTMAAPGADYPAYAAVNLERYGAALRTYEDRWT